MIYASSGASFVRRLTTFVSANRKILNNFNFVTKTCFGNSRIEGILPSHPANRFHFLLREKKWAEIPASIYFICGPPGLPARNQLARIGH